MAEYYHVNSVCQEKCDGHLKCIRKCPTQAIRYRNRLIQISNELCIDCGACIPVCPQGAIETIPPELPDYKYTVALPSPVLYTQFDSNVHPFVVHQALKEIGFDEVVDVSVTTMQVAQALADYVRNHQGRRPLISSWCPSLVRLIQVRYPDLVELIIPIEVPREIVGREIRRTFPERLGIKPEELGIVYLTPCPAVTVSITQPAEKHRSWIDTSIPINMVYAQLTSHVQTLLQDFTPEQVPADFCFHTGWSMLGNITRMAHIENWFAVSGLSDVMMTLDDIENSRLRNIDFLEASTCHLGCIGGSFNVENPYVARTNAVKHSVKYGCPESKADQEVQKRIAAGYYLLEHQVRPRPLTFLDTDLTTSLKRMREIDQVYKNLRQIDCGVCGAPTCKAFAEDFVRGEAKLTDCIFLADRDGGGD